ncbi:MAG: PocR ligand-binding domain-containing protein [Vampirovibrionia bacterium]
MQQNNIALTSVVNIEKLSSLFKNFSEATGLTVGMLEHPSQDILFMHGCSDVCLYFHRTVPDHPDFCTIKFLNKDNKNTLPGESYVGCCPNGMNHGCIAVNINNIQVASIFIGQVFFNKPDLDYFEKQAVRYGFNVEDYLNKIIKVPIIERYKFNSYLEYLRGLALIITEMNNAKLSDQNKKLQLEIKEHNLKNEILTRREVERILKETQIKFLAISEAAKDVIILIDSKGVVTYCNPAIEKVFGYYC